MPHEVKKFAATFLKVRPPIAAGVARWKRGTHCDRSDLESLRQALADARTEAAEQRIRAEAAEAELRSLRQEVAR